MKDKKTVEYYNARAPEYEQIYYRDDPQRRKEIDDEAEFVRGLAAGKTVLDLCCGSGYWTHQLSQTADLVVGSDVAHEMINQAIGKEYRSPVHFVRSDIYQLPFRLQAFDLVTLGFWFSHHPRQDYDQLLDLIAGPLKSSGKIWMIDNNPPAEGANQDTVGRDQAGNNRKRRLLSDGSEFTIIKNYFDRDLLEQIFSPKFHIERLVHQKYYWSVVLSVRPQHSRQSN